MHKLAIVLCFLASFCLCAKLPLRFKQCNKEDENFDECITKAVEFAIRQMNRPIKKYGLPSLEPLKISSISVEAGNDAVAFEQNFTYLHIFGLTKANVKKFDINFEANTVEMECIFSELKYLFNFSFNGTVVSVPILGTGLGQAYMDKPVYILRFKLDRYVNDNKEYFKVINGTLTMTAERIRDIRLDGLFDGDKVLEDQMNKVFNDNWEIIFEQAKGSYEVILGKYFSAMFNNLLTKVSISEIFGDV